MKKHTGFITGFIMGSLIFGSISFAAEAVTGYMNTKKISVNGTESIVTTVNVNDTNYVKFRDLASAMGGTTAYDEVSDMIKVTTNLTANTSDTNNTDVSSMNETNTKPVSTPDGITTIDEYKGNYYIGIYDVKQKCFEKGYTLSYDALIKDWTITKDSIVILKNVVTSHIYDGTEIEYNYYINIILPLLK